MTEIAFVDCETTGLDPDRHEIWELAIIKADHDPDVGVVNETEYVWQFPVDLSVADPMALRIGRFYERRSKVRPSGDVAALCRIAYPSTPAKWDSTSRIEAAELIARLLDGRHMVGAVPSFDAKFLERFLRRHGHCPTWHYHLVDVEALAAGWLAGAKPDWLAADVKESQEYAADTARPPWKSDDLTRAVGVEITEDDRHTALGDARWAMATYKAVLG